MADKITPRKYKAISKAKPAPVIQPLMVEKADGTIGRWGNDIPEVKNNKQYRLHPEGIITQEDYDYLKSLNDNKVNDSLARNIASPTEVPLYGQSESDLFKSLLSKRLK